MDWNGIGIHMSNRVSLTFDFGLKTSLHGRDSFLILAISFTSIRRSSYIRYMLSNSKSKSNSYIQQFNWTTGKKIKRNNMVLMVEKVAQKTSHKIVIVIDRLRVHLIFNKNVFFSLENNIYSTNAITPHQKRRFLFIASRRHVWRRTSFNLCHRFRILCIWCSILSHLLCFFFLWWFISATLQNLTVNCLAILGYNRFGLANCLRAAQKIFKTDFSPGVNCVEFA